jgi:hypothetical protein
MKSQAFELQQNKRGDVVSLKLNEDETQMNWVIDPDYLTETGYQDDDKLFGEFTLTVDGKTYNSIDFEPTVVLGTAKSTVTYRIADLTLQLTYRLQDCFIDWQLQVKNRADSPVVITNLGVWASFAYVMFRDLNVKRNANQSAAAFPSISSNYTKLALVRRDNTAPNLGLYQVSGTVRSIGTYNEYNNRFFENVSPSLDGMLFHQLILAGGYPDGNGPKNDWLYSQAPITLAENETTDWRFALAPFRNQADFYQVGTKFNHPIIKFSSLVTVGQQQVLAIQTVPNQAITALTDVAMVNGVKQVTDLLPQLTGTQLAYDVNGLGEHQVIVTFADGTQDMVIFNVMSSIKQLLRDRANYISTHSYSGSDGKVPYSFGPISNQGESLGKMSFVVQECLLDSGVTERALKIQQVEESAVKYVVPKWFNNGNFKQPAKLYGDFYRVMDLEYIAHLFYLLSQCDAADLKLNTPQTYLSWAAQIFDVRVNPDLHDNERGKAEAKMMGQYFLYIEDLLAALKTNHLDKEYAEISKSWQQATDRIAQDSEQLAAAMTEHFFDNAGFGPAAGALALSGHRQAAARYGELLKANIGFSNDFRSQSPDRWWEALSYMMHSLWGGVTAASALMTGRELNDSELVKAAYRGTVALLYMYDSNATATDRQLKPGEAASTYSIAGPNLNRPDLSRNRFGQSIFASNGGIFTRLFPDGYTGEDDWDMGEELVAFLNGFGQETYVYEDGNGLHAINGRVVTADDSSRMQVVSAAPYPTRYIDLTQGKVLSSSATSVDYVMGTGLVLSVNE